MTGYCGLELGSPFFLAPLAGFTDAGFRALALASGAALVFTEMVSAKGMMYGSPGTDALLYTEDGTAPLTAVQLFGSDPEAMFKAASDPRLAPFPFIDINMGCPVKKVFSSGDGSAVMRSPSLVEELVRAAKEGSGKPVTVKIRAGITPGTPLAAGCARAAERAGAFAVTVHPRYREQMYGGEADHSLTAAVKDAVGIPVTASGDITDADSYLAVREQSRADAFMIGRGALGRPWIFAALKETESLRAAGERDARVFREVFAKHSNGFDALDAVKRHLSVLEKILPPRAAANCMKLHVCRYAAGLPCAKKVRTEVVSALTPGDILAVAEKYFGGSEGC